MEFVQERITTLHDFTDPVPSGSFERTTVVVPMMEHELGREYVSRTFSELVDLKPGRVIVPLRATQQGVGPVCRWFDSIDYPITVLWCNGPTLESRLNAGGLGGRSGKGLDVWLAMGVAATTGDFVVIHDVDGRNYTKRHVSRLVWPLKNGFSFSKGYYARVENGRLYGRLFRLFFVPLLEALATDHDAPVLDYLRAFRYALAGECAMTADFARSIRANRRWGLEVGILGDAFAHAGFNRTAQVDIGIHRHDHRPVEGPGGLTEMANQVGRALFTVVREYGITPDIDRLTHQYREHAFEYIERYATDAAFNDLDFDADHERGQIEHYAGTICPPPDDDRLPMFRDASIDPEDVLDAARVDYERVISRVQPQR